MYRALYLEVSGKCNALCRWCVSGHSNRLKRNSVTGFIDPETFDKALGHLETEKLIDENTIVHIYNRGEPFLHPNLNAILHILNDRGYFFTISTNASVVPVLTDTPDFLKNLCTIMFSMPGFSQSSYDKMHGFQFETIKKNILSILEIARARGFNGDAQIIYHSYQFNQNELSLASQFALANGIFLTPIDAFFISNQEFMAYVEQTMEPATLYEASKELMLHSIDERRALRPEGYICPNNHEILFIDEFCNVLVCCAIDRETEGFSVGNLFEMDANQIISCRENAPICKKCGALHIDYIYTHSDPLKQGLLCGNEQSVCYDEDGNVLPFQYSIDSPIRNSFFSDKMSVEGWALDGTGIYSVTVKIDEQFIGMADYGLLRNDVAKAFPSYENMFSGYQCNIDLNGLSQGEHVLTVLFRNRANTTWEVSIPITT